MSGYWRTYEGEVYRTLHDPGDRPVVVIDPDDREQVERLTGALAIHGANPNDRNYWRETQAALRSLVAPPKCEAILNVKGQHIGCDKGECHSLPHGNVEHGAVWQGVGA